MEKIGREVLDFKNVESFSQLPITRPVKEKLIRLFGKEFGGGGHSTNTMTATNMSESIDSNPFHDELETNTMNPANNITKESHIGKNVEIEISRKYECHYCFRCFPTSQALGGHQNAHKKERQNAKLAHSQSSIVHAKNVYGITSHHRLGETAATATRTHHHHSTWTNNIITPSRFYGNGQHVNVISPINGSPLAFWKIPLAIHHNNSSSSCSNLVFSNDDLIRTSPMVKISTNNCESNFVYEPKGEVQDHVSLDLHL